MADPIANDALLTVGVGGGAALLGAGATALSENMPRKQVVATMFSGLGLGCFVPPALTAFWAVDWRIAGITGFILGLLCIPIVAGLRKAGTRFAEKPGAFIPRGWIRDAVTDHTPKPVEPRADHPTPSESKGGGK